MKIYSTCAGCHRELVVTDELPNIHIGCTPPPDTELDRLVIDFIRAVVAENDDEAQRLETQIDAMTRHAPGLAAAAQWYVDVLRWPVFPLKVHSKVPATRNGFKDATLDSDVVRRYWKANPNANIGLPTGIAFDVIDVDVPAGLDSYLAIEKSPRLADVHGRVTTSSGGIHLYVLPTGRGNTAGMAPGIDYRGEGGYVVAPPSWLGSRGTSWSWRNMPSPRIKGK